MNVLVEAVGSPVWGTILPYLRTVAKHIVGLDIDPLAFGLYLVDRGYVVPGYGHPDCMETLLDICLREQVDLVIPSIHEGLGEWAKRREELSARGITVVISPPETIAVCHDKWKTYQFFIANHIPTPKTSLAQEYELMKPRVGRGADGVRRVQPGQPIELAGCMTQELLEGQEYSVDALCDWQGQAVYIVPRKRLVVESGVSVKGEVVRDDEIEGHVRRILGAARFIGPVDIQCFRTDRGVFFTEINPRIAGGLSLSMAATENWFEVLVRMLHGQPIQPKPVRDGLLMLRYFSDRIVEPCEVISS